MRQKLFAKCGSIEMKDGTVKYVVPVYTDKQGLFILDGAQRIAVRFDNPRFIFVEV